jgi:hypothetical protein
MKKEVIRHLKSDKAMFKREAAEDEKLIKRMSKKHKEHEAAEKRAGLSEAEEHSKAVKVKKVVKGSKSKASKKLGLKGKKKLDKVMKEFAAGKLHSGSKKGPKVKNVKQALAIGYSEAQRAQKNK